MYHSICRKALGQCCPYEACQVRKEAALSLVRHVLLVMMRFRLGPLRDRDFLL